VAAASSLLFVCGLITGKLLHKHKHDYLFSNEGYADLLSLIVWLLFGAVVITRVWPFMEWQCWVYAAASLTLLRMVPVLISLIGTSLSWEQRLFIGWFGPRGLASIVFIVIVLQYPLVLRNEIGATVICTILLSVVLHGISANPWVNRLKYLPKTPPAE
jgi:NhaP-type Na+/H+ or K+/H+ antiporter